MGEHKLPYLLTYLQKVGFLWSLDCDCCRRHHGVCALIMPLVGAKPLDRYKGLSYRLLVYYKRRR